MDHKTICDILRNPAITFDRYNMAPMDRSVMRELADFIEQQQKYAELGRLAIKTKQMLCPYEFESDGCKYSRKHIFCHWIQFCQKRAELLVKL